MSETHLTDREVELILAGSRTGSDDLAGLEKLVAGISATTPPPNDPDQMATALAATARSTRKSRGLRRLATIAASAALVVAMSGVAMAADGAVPGDMLYGIDRALETIGIGDGGVDERLGEFDALVQRGEEEKAFDFLNEVITGSPEAASSEAQRHLEAAVNGKSTAGEDNGRNEEALGSSPGQAISTEHKPDNPGQPDAGPEPEPGSGAVGQDDHPQQPRGEERSDEVRTEPETAGPKDDNPSGQTNSRPERDEEDTSQPNPASPQNAKDPPGQNKNN